MEPERAVFTLYRKTRHPLRYQTHEAIIYFILLDIKGGALRTEFKGQKVITKIQGHYYLK